MTDISLITESDPCTDPQFILMVQSDETVELFTKLARQLIGKSLVISTEDDGGLTADTDVRIEAQFEGLRIARHVWGEQGMYLGEEINIFSGDKGKDKLVLSCTSFGFCDYEAADFQPGYWQTRLLAELGVGR